MIEAGAATASTNRMVIDQRRPEAATTVLAVAEIAKSFGSTEAIRSASLDLQGGEVHCIVGENGSGKSTLVKILSGIHSPDAGTIEIGGHPQRRLRTPRAALREGIATVFQEVLVVEPRSILENVWLGWDGVLRTRMGEASKRQRAAAILQELLGRRLSLDAPVEALSLPDRQACCLARALVREPRVLILDESTSALDIATRDRLFEIVRRLAARGTAVIFISHRMDEIMEIADRCTVMRSGRTVSTLERTQVSAAELVRLMTGSDHLAPTGTRVAALRRTPGAVKLRARRVALSPGAAPFDLDIRAGELIGLAGLEGHGQDQLIKALWGEPACGGEVLLVSDSGEERIESRAQAAARGIAYVPRERRTESLFESKSIRENFGLPTLDRDVRRMLLRPAQTRLRLGRYVDRLSIKLSSPEALIGTLSGGNQQKVVMARWLATEPSVLLLNDPTRGVDIATKRSLYELLIELATGGVAIVMLSTELDEHVELMDRVLVFRENCLFSQLQRDHVDRQALLSAFFGHEETPQRSDGHVQA